jgi:hypothetical protein
MIRLFSMLVLALVAQAPAPTPAEPPSPAAERVPPMILLYDSIPDPFSAGGLRGTGAEVWLQINQDPESYKTGIIDTLQILRQIESRSGGSPPSWIMLDFEEPFFKDLSAADGSPERTRAVSSMLSTLRAVKERWPEVKFGFYGLPSLPFWVSGKGWSELDPDEKRAALEKARRDAAPLLAEVDWVSPSVYAYYDPTMVRPGSPDSIRGTPQLLRQNDLAWRSAQVGLAVLMAKGKPVLPTVCPFWAPGGVAPWCHWIDRRSFIEHQIEPAVRMRAQGVMLWTGMSYRIRKVTDPKMSDGATERNFGVPEWRAAFQKDLLGSQAPTDWSDPELRRRLEQDTTRAIVGTVVDIRSWERSGALPTEGAPVVPPPG